MSLIKCRVIASLVPYATAPTSRNALEMSLSYPGVRFRSAPLQVAYLLAFTVQTFELSAVSPSSASRSPLGDGMAAKK